MRSAETAEGLLEAVEEDDLSYIAGFLNDLNEKEPFLLSDGDKLNLVLAHNYLSENNYEGLKELAEDTGNIDGCRWRKDYFPDTSAVYAGLSALGGYLATKGYNIPEGPEPPIEILDDVLMFLSASLLVGVKLHEWSTIEKPDRYDLKNVDGRKQFPDPLEEVRETLDSEYGVNTYKPARSRI